MSILIVAEDEASSSARMRIFEPLIREIAASHGHVDSIQASMRSADIWSYQIEGQVPMLVECHATGEYISKETLTAFFGQYKADQLRCPDIVGVLLTTNEFTTSTADSARAFYRTIQRQSPDEKLFIYDADEILALMAKRRRLASPEEIADWFNSVSASGIVNQNLLVTPEGSFWALELGGTDSGRNLLLDAVGLPVPSDATKGLPWKQITAIRNGLSQDSLVNDRYTESSKSSGQSSYIIHQPVSRQSLLDFIGTHRTHLGNIERLVRLAQGRFCRERGDAVCSELERWCLTFFDTMASSYLVIPESANKDTAEKFVDKACAAVAAVRIAALSMSSSWIHVRERGPIGDLETFVSRLIKDIHQAPAWYSLVPRMTATICKTFHELSEGQEVKTDQGLLVVAALAIHLGAAIGPYSETYRATVLQKLQPDEKPELTGAATFSSCWVDVDSQQLRIAVGVETPRSHRFVMRNRVLLLPIVEKTEDALGGLGDRLPFTRIHVSTNNADFELVECFFELESENILKIFMGEELYGNKDVWVRELLQNAIDATLLRKALVDEEEYHPEILITYGMRDRELQIIDNGMGMALYHVRKFFSKVGRSFYRSAELEDQLKRRNRKFNPISRFGVGFLSIFMVSDSAEILTRHVQTSESGGDSASPGLSVFIPGLMEDFYVRERGGMPEGTKVILELKQDLKTPIQDLITRYLLCPSVDIKVVSSSRAPIEIKATDKLSIFPTVVPSGPWISTYDIISAHVASDDYEALINVLVPKPGQVSSEGRNEPTANELPKTRVAVAQAGIWVKDDNTLFGEKRGPGEAYHPYFRRVYGLINFKSGALKINVARNEFVLDDQAAAALKKRLLAQAISSFEDQVARVAASIQPARRRNEYVRAVLMESVQDGEEYYYASSRRSVSQYNYANSELLKSAMARLYAAHYTLEQRGQDLDAARTVNDVVQAGNALGKLYYTLKSDIHEDSLFSAWLAEQPANSRVFYCRSRREAALLIAAFRQAGHTQELTELKQDVLQLAIHFTVIPGPLDDYLKACAAVVQYGQYKPSTGLLVMPVTPETVSKMQGLNYKRSGISGDPYVLLDKTYWLTDFMVEIALLAKDDAIIANGLRDLCDVLVRNIALGENAGIRQEALHVANNNLTQLYAHVERVGQGERFACVRGRSMLTLAELIGARKTRR